MSDARSVVELVFQGVDKTGEATQAALNNAQKFSASVQAVAAPIADTTERLVKFQAAILATGAAVTAFAIKVAGDFDLAFRELTTIFSIPEESIGDFRDSILEYSKTSTQSLEQITNSLYTAASGGVAWAESLEFLAVAEKLAVAGKADLNSVTKVLNDTLKAYGEDLDQAGRYSDVFFQTVKEGQITIPQLAENLAKVTQVAATLGVPIEDVGGAIAALTGQGVQVSEAFTQINAILTAFIKPTKEAADIAKELGIEFNVQAVQSKGLYGALQDVYEATGGSEEAMARLFGRIEATKGVFSLTGDAADFFASKLGGVKDSAGATEEAYAKMAGNIKDANQTLRNQLNALLVEIGDPLLEEYGNITRAIGAVFNALGENVKKGELGGIVKYIESVMAEIAAAFNTLAINLPGALKEADLDGFQRNIEGTIDGIRKLFSGVDISTEKGLADLIEGVGNLIGNLGTFAGDAIATLKPLVDALLAVAKVLGDLDPEFVALTAKVGGFAFLIDKVLGPAFDALLLILVAKSVGVGTGGIVGALASVGKGIAPLLPLLGKTGLAGAAGVGGFALGSVLADGIDKVVDKFTGSGSLGGLIYDITNGTEEWTTATVTATREQQGLAESAGQTAEEIAKLDREFDLLWEVIELGGQAFDSVEEAQQNLIEGQRIFFDEATKKWLMLPESVKYFRGELVDVGGEFDELGKRTAKLGEQFTEAGRTFEYSLKEGGEFYWKLVDGPKAAEEATKRWIETTVDGVKTFTQAGGNVSSALDAAGKSAEEAEKKSESYLLKMEEIASNERIANIEAKVSLDIAQLEADTARVQAAFESIDNTISVTTQSITDLFGVFAQVDRFDQNKVLDQIERENKVRDEGLKKQNELIDAQIDSLRAKTDALQRGDSLIQVDGAGLQPHLEAFMWEILRTIQVRVNEDGMEMLLGAT